MAAKCTLASRVDSFHESSDGKVTVGIDCGRHFDRKRGWGGGKPTDVFQYVLKVGYDLKEEIERKFDKWQEPPPVKQVKPLPAPLDGQRKKRGGRRCPLPYACDFCFFYWV